MALTLRDHLFAEQLDDYSRAVALFASVQATFGLHENRLDLHISLISGVCADNDRQDEALTELESRVLDLEKMNANLWQTLNAQRAPMQVRIIGRTSASGA